MEQNRCVVEGRNIMIMSCSGAANVGQLANKVAVELTQEGFGKLFCLAGIGGHLSGFVRSAREVPVKVVIDGCPVGCARAILEHLEIPLGIYLVLTDLGIEKRIGDFNLQGDDVQKVKKAIKERCKGDQPRGITGNVDSDTGPCCC